MYVYEMIQSDEMWKRQDLEKMYPAKNRVYM